MKAIKSLQIWLYKDVYYVRAYSQTTVGLRTTRYNEIHVVPSTEISSLSKVILETFNECQMSVLHPDFSVKQPKSKMLELVGLRTHKELEKKGRTLCISLKENLLMITPWFFNGKHLEAKDDLFCSLDPDDITQTVLKAFEQCHR
jgi:predicted nuclease of restriction endonuclease-like RecB superfamily